MRRSWLCCLALIVLCGCEGSVDTPTGPAGQLRLVAVLGPTGLNGNSGDDAGYEANPGGYATADKVRSFTFPLDHGSHPAYRSEWWYLTCILEDQAGREFGVQFTLFRQALSPGPPSTGNRWQSNQAFLGHFAVTDVAAGTHQVAERAARGHPRLAGVVADPFELWLEDWRIDSMGDQWRLSLGSMGQRSGSMAQQLDLTLDMSGSIVLQGDSGLSHKGPLQASYYYSMPGIPVSGQLNVNGAVHVVSGSGWLDREWSTSVLGDGQTGWDWFALQLNDGSEVLVFQLRQRDGTRDPYDQGVRLMANGERLDLTTDDFSMTPLRYWTGPRGIKWPVAWQIQLLEDTWRVEAAVDDQLMNTAVVYWEGLVNVYDSSDIRIGQGYLELTGYSRPRGDEG
ncbi:MAG: lipocalin-like domain-containing protein [Pseudomonadales bacterium]